MYGINCLYKVIINGGRMMTRQTLWKGAWLRTNHLRLIYWVKPGSITIGSIYPAIFEIPTWALIGGEAVRRFKQPNLRLGQLHSDFYMSSESMVHGVSVTDA